MKKKINQSKNDFLERLKNSEYLIVLILILIILISGPIVPHFLSINNLMNILTRTTIIATASIGMTYVIITGGIDLSVGGVVIFCSYVGVATLLQDLGLNIYLVALSMLGLGAIIGMVNGFSVVVLRMPPFIATLAMMNITRGLSHFIYKAQTVFGLPRSWRYFSSGKLIGVPMSIVIFLIFFLVAYLHLKFTASGRHIFAVGNNARVARLSGIKTKKVIFSAYVISGITGGAVAVILTSRIFSVVGTLGNGLELDVISAVVIGGTSLFGGVGTVFGSLVGAIIIETVSNILTLSRVSPFFVLVAKGLVLWLAVLLDMIRKGYLFKEPEG